MKRSNEDFLRVEHLKTYYPAGKNFFGGTNSYVKAVDDVSFSLGKGETLGLVGESGCGKSTLGRSVLRLEEALSGAIFYKGRDILKLNEEEMRTLREEIQIIFQDPYSSLNPKMTVGEIVGEPMLVHGVCSARERGSRVGELLEMVGLKPEYAKRYPHQFSGGQRQRIGIARALAVRPQLIVCDEAVSALDVSIQAQILNLLARLQKELDLSYLFIGHGLATVKHISNRIGVMYLGKLVELADSDELYRQPAHPYSQALISAIPEPDPDAKRQRLILSGDVPSPSNPPEGCRFHTRCPQRVSACDHEEPELREISEGHTVACHLKMR
jgi:oligopeptide/dipeptide ABC transporter ATP-binding protein